LLDDLDKELNTYAMRVREWYGWHFPEMTKIVAGMHGHMRACVCVCVRGVRRGGWVGGWRGLSIHVCVLWREVVGMK
jgi:hypothetical protein